MHKRSELHNSCSVRGRWLALFPLCLALTACEQQQMARQPGHKPMQPSAFFPDKRLARPLVVGTVARDSLLEGSLLTGKKRSSVQAVQAAEAVGVLIGSPVAGFAVTATFDPYRPDFPEPLSNAMLTRGQERFNIFCAVCHDRAGTGKGMIWQRGYAKPPSFHIPRLRQAPVGYYFEVVTNGFGAMPEYGSQIPPRDRWAIIAYIRALQLSRNATVADVPPRTKIHTGGKR
jgi:mono/diheme cytochrome c family protein